MSATIDITLDNFEDVVIQGSMERPIVVEFTSPRSPACKQVGTILESLSRQMDFTLARVDIDQNPQIGTYFRLTTVPDVRVLSQGKIIDTLSGSLNEAQLRKSLSRHFLSAEDLAFIDIEALLQQGQNAEALALLDPLLATRPMDKKLLYCKAKAFVDMGETEKARSILSDFNDGDDFYREAKALAELMAFHQEVARKDLSDPVDLRFQESCRVALEGNYRTAMDGFLEIVQNHRLWRDDAARKALLTLFGVLGPKHELTWEYRSKLNTILFI